MSTKIITHGDTDGVISASLISLIEDGDVYFSHPHGLLDDINSFVDKGDRIYILDIALDEKLWKRVVDILNEYGKKGQVIYFDHHPKPIEFRDSMFKYVTYVNEPRRSTSEIIHEYYRERMPLEASRLTLLGGIGDYSDETPYMRKLYSYWDKRMIYFEAGILSQALEASRRLYDYKRMIIEKLSKGYIPSQIPQLIERAVKMSLEEEEMRREMKKEMKVLKYIAYVINPKGSISRAARYLIGLSGKSVGVAIEERRDIAIMSLRARRDAIDLNELLRSLTLKYNGSGGGHPYASGARVPLTKLDKFLEALDKEIGRYIKRHEYPLHISP